MIIPVLGYMAVGFFIDKNNYDKGYQAYLQLDCSTAAEQFDRVGFQMIDFGSYRERSQKYEEECRSFQAGVDNQLTGSYDIALLAFADFVKEYTSSAFVNPARDHAWSIFEDVEFSDITTEETCSRIEDFQETDLMSNPNSQLPLLYFACAQYFDETGDQQGSYAMYITFLTEYPEHTLTNEVKTSLLTNVIACNEVDALKSNSGISDRTDFLPSLYYGCGQLYEAEKNYEDSLDMYIAFLTEYPEHTLANEVETSLSTNPVACNEAEMLQSSGIIDDPSEFLPSLFYGCGETFAQNRDFSNAIRMFEEFLDNYPNHHLAPDVEKALATTLISEARTSGAGTIAPPTSSGSTSSGSTVVVIQNDSPERLRIVFSGPETRIEELSACPSCTNYSRIGPLYCPEKGPIGRYRLDPGQYSVLVEASSGGKVTPFTGHWSLSDGQEYYSCFFIVTSFSP